LFSSPFRGPVLAQTGGFVQCFFHHFRATWQRGWGVVGRQLYVGGDADALQRSPGSFDNLYKKFLRNSAPFPLLCCIFVDVLPPFAWSARPVVPQRGPRCRTMVAPLLFNCAPVVVQWRPRCGAIGVPLRCFLFSFLSVLAGCFVETAENQSFGETRPKLKNSGQNKVCSPSSESQRRSCQFFFDLHGCHHVGAGTGLPLHSFNRTGRFSSFLRRFLLRSLACAFALPKPKMMAFCTFFHKKIAELKDFSYFCTLKACLE